jgi:hypothetical protein
MSDAVFILGAGASRKAGAPLMSNFLDVSRDLVRLGRAEDAKPHFEEVFKGISRLQYVHSKSQLDIHNIESVFAAFEMASTLGQFGDYSRDQLDNLLGSMRLLISKTIEQTLRFPVVDGRLEAPPPYGEFYNLLRYSREEAIPLRSVAVITFNYDVALDFALEKENVYIDYGLTDRRSTGIPLLKLHGSLNWRRCGCGAIVPWSISDFLHSVARPGADRKDVALGIGSGKGPLKHCDKEMGSDPVLVPPTWNKSEYHRTLAAVWGRAAAELREAEDIYILGYSLPPSDTFFRYLYALGTVSEKQLRRFWVFDPESTGAVKTRFEQLLGPGAQQRFQYFERVFESGIGSIKKRL